ncbi:MAG TPA: phosphatase PAP2 family protein [Gemmatimonadales bacterium]|nr:phosphatase PAP2 family protein [Gemmatimonadales bacterium]
MSHTAPLQSARSGIRTWVKATLLGMALVMVFMPRNRISPFAYPLLFGVPLVYAAIRRDAERAFLLWTTYAISFATFVVLRRLADEAGMPWLHGYVIDVDRAIGLGTLPTVIVQRLWYSPAAPSLLDAATVGFHLSYYLVPPIAAMLLWSADRSVFERYLVTISATYLVGLLVHFALPTVPPWMAGDQGYTEPISRVLYDRISVAWPQFYAFGHLLAGGNDVAAMPSLHMATSYLVALGASKIGRAAGTVGVLYALGMGFSLVYTGEHYVADLIGGIAIAWLCWAVAPRLLDRFLPSGRTGSPVTVRLR